jgi:small subunit ribosomal protein S15
MITIAEKAELIKKFGKSEKDSGTTEVQVAILTRRIENLTGHFSNHKLDHHSKRGLMKLIGKRRRLLRYLKGASEDRYQNVIAELGLRK